MGESYRGITIRIGADTSPLNSALRGINNALRATQSELRQVTTALRFDPSSIENTKLNMMLLAEKSQEAFSKIEMLKVAQSQLGEKNVGNATVAELANEWTDVQSRVATTREEYNRVDAALENLKIKFKELAAENGVTFDENNINGVISELQELGVKVTEDAERYRSLVEEQKQLQGTLAIQEDVAEFERLKVNIAATEADAKRLAAQFVELKAANPFSGATESNLNKLRTEMQQTDVTATSLEEQLRQIDAAMKLDPQDLGAAALKMQNLQEQAANAKTKMQGLQEQLREMQAAGVDKLSAEMANVTAHAEAAKAEFQGIATETIALSGRISEANNELSIMHAKGEENTTAYRNLATQIENDKVRLSELGAEAQVAEEKMNTANQVQQYRELGVQITETRTKMQGLSTQMGETASRGKVALSTFKSLGMTFYATVTPAVMYFGYTAMNAAKEIDTSFRDMKKTVQGTDEQFAHLKQAAIEYSTTHVTSADQILEIEAMGGQLGVATSQLESFAAVVSNIDIATDINADDAAKDIGQLENIMKDLNKDTLPGFSDALVRLGNNNATVESSIMDVTMRIGSMGSILGMSTPEVLAWSTAISSTGQNSEAAGTAMSKTMSDIEGAVGEGGDALQGFSDVAGMSAEEFAAEWSSSPSTALYNFVTGLKRISDEGGSVDNTLEQLGITSVRQKQGLEGLSQETDTLTNALKMSGDAWNGVSDQWGQAGDAEREAKQKSEGFSGALQILKNDMADLGMVAGESLTPILQALAVAVQAVTGFVSQLPGPIQTVLTSAILLAAGLGPVLTIMSSVGTAMKDVNNGTNIVKNAFDKLVRGTVSVKDALAQVNSATNATSAAAAGSVAAWDSESASMDMNAATTSRVAASKQAYARAAEEEAASNDLASASNYVYANSEEDVSLAAEQAAAARALKKKETEDFIAINTLGAMSEDEMAAAEEREAAAAAAASAEEMTLTAGMLALAAIALIAGVAFGTYAQYQDDMRNSTTGLRNASLGLDQAIADAKDGFDSGSDSVEEYGEKAGVASGNISDLTDRNKKLAETIRNNNASAGTSIAQLEAYKQTVLDLANKADKSDTDIAALKVAIDNLNKACGSHYSVDEETGAIRDQEGAAIDAADAIDKMVAAKEREIQANSLTQSMESAYQTWQDDANGAAQAEKALQDAIDKKNNSADMTDEELSTINEKIAYLTSLRDQANDKTNAAEQAYKNEKEQLILLTAAQNDNASSLTKAMYSNRANISSGLKASGQDLMDFKDNLEKAGLSEEELSHISKEQWTTIASSFDGSSKSIAAGFEKAGIELDDAKLKMLGFNDTEIKAKHAGIDIDSAQLTDAQGKIYTYNGTDLVDQDGNVAVNDTELTDAQGRVWTWNGTELVPKKTTAEVKGNAADGSGKEALDDTEDSVENLSGKNVDVDVDGNIWNAASPIWDAVRAIDALYDKTVKVVVNNITNGTANANEMMAHGGLIMTHATGALIQAHAAGYIATQPTVVHVAGEAGSEAVIPLSNRKYVRPFAAAVAAEVANVGGNNSAQIAALTAEVQQLRRELGQTIADNAPVVVESEKDFARRVRSSV